MARRHRAAARGRRPCPRTPTLTSHPSSLLVRAESRHADGEATPRDCARSTVSPSHRRLALPWPLAPAHLCSMANDCALDLPCNIERRSLDQDLPRALKRNAFEPEFAQHCSGSVARRLQTIHCCPRPCEQATTAVPLLSMQPSSSRQAGRAHPARAYGSARSTRRHHRRPALVDATVPFRASRPRTHQRRRTPRQCRRPIRVSWPRTRCAQQHPAGTRGRRRCTTAHQFTSTPPSPSARAGDARRVPCKSIPACDVDAHARPRLLLARSREHDCATAIFLHM
ncbi:hypothetical protein BKA93DRAFT_541292 [Sparassis latifolia]